MLPVKFRVSRWDSSTKSWTPEMSANMSVVSRQEAQHHRWPYETLPHTHFQFQRGYYQSTVGDEPTPGEWLLVVSTSETSPVVQRLTLQLDNKTLHARAGWGGTANGELSRQAATVSITNYDQVPGSAPAIGARQAVVQIRLWPRREVVLLAGHDYARGGAPFHAACLDRRAVLYLAHRIDPATIITYLDLDARKTQRFVKAATPRADAWVLVGEDRRGPARAPDKKEFEPGSDLSILDLYAYLHDVGRMHPATVVEASVFSHGYWGGPILWNTYDAAPSFIARDPNDGDGRTKDHLPGGVTETTYPELFAAFRPDGELRLWGCVHQNEWITSARRAHGLLQSGHDRNAFFWVRYGIPGSVTGGKIHQTLEHLRRSIVERARGDKHARFQQPKETGERQAIYPGAAARGGVHVWAAPPGMGASYRSIAGRQHMIIDTTTPGSEGQPPENLAAMKYYQLEFGSDFVTDDHGYLDYREFRKVPRNDPGWRTERCWMEQAIFDESLKDGQPLKPKLWNIMRLPSGLTVRGRGPSGAFEAPVLQSLDNEIGHMYVAPATQIVNLEQRDTVRFMLVGAIAGEALGLFVGESGRTRALRRVSGQSAFVPYTRPLPLFKASFAGKMERRVNFPSTGQVFPKTAWRINKTPSAMLTDGIVEETDPRWYW